MSATLEAIPNLLSDNTPALSGLDLVDEVANGLPIATAERIARSVAPDDAAFVYRLAPRSTLARRRLHPGGRLSIEESARVARLAAVWEYARLVWKSDASARTWLFKPHMMLRDRRPIDVVLASEFGRPPVEDILGGLLYGTAI